MEKVWSQCIIVERFVLDITRFVDNDYRFVNQGVIIVIGEVSLVLGCYRLRLIDDTYLIEA